LAGVSGDGTVTIEGHFVGRLRGLSFEAAQGAGALESKALRAAVQRAVGPEMSRRLGRLAAEADDAFTLQADGAILWRGEAAGALAGGQPFNPAVRLHGDLGAAPVRERALRRLEAFVAADASRRLWALKGLGEAVSSGLLKGLARGLAYRLIESGGVLDRRRIEAELIHLSKAERGVLRGLGVRFGAFSLFLPSQTQPDARDVAVAFARQAAPEWRPPEAALVALADPQPPALALGLRGLLAVGGLAVPAHRLERLDDHLRSAADSGGVRLVDAARESLGWSEAEARRLLRDLGFAPIRKAVTLEATLWRRRRPRVEAAVPQPPTAHRSPFAALAALRRPAAPASNARPKPRRRRRPAGAAPP
jgi:ATP-dependent RNA helicase SUPV3L1/SUV3